MENSEKRKKLLLIGGGVVAVVVAVVLVILSMTVWATPHKKDFEEANKAVQTAKASYQKIAKPYAAYFTAIGAAYQKDNTPAAVIKTVSGDKNAFESAIDTHLNDVKAIDGMRALNDKELRTSYDKYKDHEEAYGEYMKNYLAAHALYMQATGYSCADVFTASKAAQSAKSIPEYVKLYGESNRKLSKDCLEDLTTLMRSPNKPYATYAKAYRQYFVNRQNLIDKAQKSSSARTSLSHDMRGLTAPVQEATATFITARQQSLDKVSKQDTAKAFYELVAKKVKTAKE